jgi:hypothetical protein
LGNFTRRRKGLEKMEKANVPGNAGDMKPKQAAIVKHTWIVVSGTRSEKSGAYRPRPSGISHRKI